MPTARDRYREAVTETLTGWRLGCIPLRPDWGREQEIIRAGVAEILQLRLQIAYTPIFETLQRIENQLAIVAAMREDVYAPIVPARLDVERGMLSEPPLFPTDGPAR